MKYYQAWLARVPLNSNLLDIESKSARISPPYEELEQTIPQSGESFSMEVESTLEQDQVFNSTDQNMHGKPSVSPYASDARGTIAVEEPSFKLLTGSPGIEESGSIIDVTYSTPDATSTSKSLTASGTGDNLMESIIPSSSQHIGTIQPDGSKQGIYILPSNELDEKTTVGQSIEASTEFSFGTEIDTTTISSMWDRSYYSLHQFMSS